jgi:hypothetical protein
MLKRRDRLRLPHQLVQDRITGSVAIDLDGDLLRDNITLWRLCQVDLTRAATSQQPHKAVAIEGRAFKCHIILRRLTITVAPIAVIPSAVRASPVSATAVIAGKPRGRCAYHTLRLLSVSAAIG